MRLLTITLATKDQRLAAFRIVIGVFAENVVVIDFKAILPADAGENQVDLKMRRTRALVLEQERVSTHSRLMVSVTE